MLPRPQFWCQSMLHELVYHQDPYWAQQFRVSREKFNFIVQLLCGTTDKRNTRLQDAISIKKRVAVALWRLATGNSYRTISSTFGMGKSTAIQITNEFLDAINALYGDWIKFRDSSRHGRIYWQVPRKYSSASPSNCRCYRWIVYTY